MLAEFTEITRARRGELPPRYYTRRRVRFVISPGSSGGWSIVPAGDGEGISLPVPTVYRSGAKPPPMLIADTALYVLGVPKDGTAKSKQAALTRHRDDAALIDSFAAASAARHPDCRSDRGLRTQPIPCGAGQPSYRSGRDLIGCGGVRHRRYLRARNTSCPGVLDCRGRRPQGLRHGRGVLRLRANCPCSGQPPRTYPWHSNPRR